MPIQKLKVTGPVARHINVYKIDNTSPTVPYDPDDFLVEEFYKRTEGFNTPKYHLRLKQGALLPFTIWRQVEISGSSALAPLSWTHTATGSWAQRPVSNSSTKAFAAEKWRLTEADLNSSFTYGDAQYCVQSAASKIYSSGWDALTFAAELGKTVHMFRSLISNLAGFLRGLPPNVKWNVPFNKWLELRYGWRTLIFDLLDFEKAMSSVDGGRKRLKERVGKNHKSESISLWSYALAPGTLQMQTTTQFEYGYRGSIVADIEPPKISFNPLITAWEVVTLSFVVDWFLNIGQWLESLSFLAIERQYVAGMGAQLKMTRTMVRNSITVNSGYTYSWNPAALYEAKIVRRDPTNVPLLPQISVRLDAFKVMDLIALAVQRFLRR